MIFTNVVLLGTAALASARNPYGPFKRADGEGLTFPLDTIPASCDGPCTVFKDIFGTCPGNPSAPVCAGVCNGTTLTELQVCINCTLIEGPPNNMTQFNIDVLNGAQQQLAQSCIDEGFPSQYSGEVPSPNTVPYPSGVNEATLVPNSTVAPTASPTAAANSSASASGSASANASATPAPSAAPAPSGTLASGAAALSVSGLVAVAAAGAALLL